MANLITGTAAVCDAPDRGRIEISADGMLRLPAITALPELSEPVRTRETVYKLIGNIQFPDLLMQLDAATNFSDALLGHRAQTADELVALYEEGSGRLRRANERVAQFQSQIPIAALWGDGDKASADMMSLDASRHLWNARVDPRRRTYATGLYTHVRDRWGIVYDQPIVLNERQAGVAIEGVDSNNRGEDLMRLSLVAVDTHGYTNPAMAIAKLLGFDLCPRLRDLAERKLHLPRVFRVPEGMEVLRRARSTSVTAPPADNAQISFVAHGLPGGLLRQRGVPPPTASGAQPRRGGQRP
ncbi:hypothetical protein J2739_005506 [Variovorax soli]|uniref:Tn3 transposase DDE domain-containing protein n=1 Tax=Variovorax soli TaxID=376815 RepID=A0ABU1NMQ5_9BURK|nr:hypothetical protein [Variovorax soli]